MLSTPNEAILFFQLFYNSGQIILTSLALFLCLGLATPEKEKAKKKKNLSLLCSELPAPDEEKTDKRKIKILCSGLPTTNKEDLGKNREPQLSYTSVVGPTRLLLYSRPLSLFLWIQFLHLSALTQPPPLIVDRVVARQHCLLLIKLVTNEIPLSLSSLSLSSLSLLLSSITSSPNQISPPCPNLAPLCLSLPRSLYLPFL